MLHLWTQTLQRVLAVALQSDEWGCSGRGKLLHSICGPFMVTALQNWCHRYLTVPEWSSHAAASHAAQAPIVHRWHSALPVQRMMECCGQLCLLLRSCLPACCRGWCGSCCRPSPASVHHRHSSRRMPGSCNCKSPALIRYLQL